MPREYPHGVRARYTLAGCRCKACRRANTEYEKLRQRLLGYGRSPMVEAEPVRRHVRGLLAKPHPKDTNRLGRRRVAELAGVSDSTISALLYGKRGHQTKTISRRAAERILALRPSDEDLAAGALVSSRRTRRLIHELVSFGLDRADIARRLGSQAKRPYTTIPTDRVTVRTAKKVEDLHWSVFKTHPAFRAICDCPVPRAVDDWLQSEPDDAPNTIPRPRGRT